MKLPEGHARDILVAIAVVGGILFSLYLYTGTWPPPVVVESNSMMHIEPEEYSEDFGDTRPEDVPYGRFGTVDPGDLVLVKDVDAAESIHTQAHDGDERYGAPGEVVIYFTNDRMTGTPIIHRSMTYVTALDAQGDPVHAGPGAGEVAQYEVVWHPDWQTNVACSSSSSGPLDSGNGDECTEPADCRTQQGQKVCTFDESGFRLPDLAREQRYVDEVYAPAHSGFITQGDNVVGNEAPDQALGIHDEPVPFSQIQGVARAELPWFGLIKLALTGDPGATAEVQSHPYYVTIGAMTAPQDLWVMLVAGLAVVGLAPVGLDYGWMYLRRWMEADGQGSAEAAPGSNPGPDPPGSGGPHGHEEVPDRGAEDEAPGEEEQGEGEEARSVEIQLE